MWLNQRAIWYMAALVAATGILDWHFFRQGGTAATISRTFLVLAKWQPILAIALGCLVGHLVLPRPAAEDVFAPTLGADVGWLLVAFVALAYADRLALDGPMARGIWEFHADHLWAAVAIGAWVGRFILSQPDDRPYDAPGLPLTSPQ